jgi:uncharacterized protein (TIGR00297 family)
MNAVFPSALALAGAMPSHVEVYCRQHAAAGALITIIFALLAYRMRAVDTSGALAGSLVSFVLYSSAGPGAFLTLGVVFLITAGVTRFGQEQKRRRGLAERRSGRNAWQVLANLATAALLSGLALYFRRPELLLACVAALAEAAADTASSEVGKAAAPRAFLITDFRPVKVGTDGGISWIGTLSGVLAGAAVALTAAWWKLIPLPRVPAAIGAAVLGAFLDSILGATVQRRGWIDNSGVNLVSTTAAAGLALLFLL